MLRKPDSGRKIPPGDPSNTRFFHEIEALSKALSIDTKSRRRSLPPDPTPKPSSSTSSSLKDKKHSSSSIWNRKPLKALSHIRHHRFECRFSFRVHSIEGLPPALAGASLLVHWRRTTDSFGAQTRPAKVFHGSAEFEETLTYRCSVYGSRGGPQHSAKYEARHFLLFATVVGAPGLDLGKHRVELTRILPLTLEELEGEKSSGEWSTSFRLSGKARGASLNVSFGFSVVVGNGSVEAGGDRNVDRVDMGEKKGSLRRVGSLPRPNYNGQERPCLLSRSVEDVKVFREVIKQELEFREQDGELGTLPVDSKPEFEMFGELSESPEIKCCTLAEHGRGNGENECDESVFTVVEQGIEIDSRDQVDKLRLEKLELERDSKGAGVGLEAVGMKLDQQEEFSYRDQDSKEGSLLPGDSVMEDLDSAFNSLSILEPEGLESPQIEAETSKQSSYDKFKLNYITGSMRSKSLSLDDVTEPVASEFLSMLGLENSPSGLSSGSDPESPRERLWKQFERESLTVSDGIFGPDIGVGKESDWGDFSEDFDLSSIVHAAEMEHQKESLTMKSKSRALMMEDAETEALMREWGLNEKAFESSPPGSRSRSGFGSPISLPPEEPLELPPLGENLGRVVQTKDGGFLCSMSPSLFKNSMNSGSLVMQASNPVVVPAEMGSDIMEILQSLASVGIEKLSMQASKLMPLEDITGKTMQQVAWEAASALDTCERQDFSQHLNLESTSVVGQNASCRIRKGTGLNLDSSRSWETGSEYVSLEDLAPLAMDKIEALSIEGLRIQSGMTDEEAPSNISPQFIGEISALEGKGTKNSRSLGLEGAAGLQLLDVKDGGDDVDGLMGLSITLDEWMRLDSGVVDEGEQISERTSKILAAHHAKSTDFLSRGWRADKRRGKSSSRRWGLLGNNFTVALMVQLRDPLRNYEPVGTPMLALIQVERVFLPPKPKIYSTVSEKGNSEQDDEPDTKPGTVMKEEKKVEEDAIPQFKITEVHVAGLKTEPAKKKLWGNSVQQQSGSRWLLANGMGKSNKHPFMKSNAVTKPSQVTTKVQPGDMLWSISSRVHGTGAKWKELAALNPHIRNPNVIFPNETIRLR